MNHNRRKYEIDWEFIEGARKARESWERHWFWVDVITITVLLLILGVATGALYILIADIVSRIP